MPSKLDIAWLAGLLEGEGHFRISRQHLQVELRMTDLDVVQRAASVFPAKRAEVRTSTWDHDNRSNSAVSYRYRWYGPGAQTLMEAVLPYMGERRAAKIRECLAERNLHLKKEAA